MKIIKYFVAIFIIVSFTIKAHTANPGDVVINEIAWMGTKAASGDEWIELYNNTASSISLAGWEMYEGATLIEIIFVGTVPPYGYYLIENDEDSVSVPGDLVDSSISLLNDGEHLILKNAAGVIIDEVDCSGGWFAGDSANDITMERILPGGDSNSRDNWADNNLEIINSTDSAGNPILGTPRQKNSVSFITEVDIGDKLMKVTDSPFFPYGDNPNQPIRGMITYKVEPNSFLTLTIYNINGYVIKYLKRNVLVGAVDAQGVAFWAGEDVYGDIVPVGIYIVHLRAEHRGTGEVKTEQATIVVGRKF